MPKANPIQNSFNAGELSSTMDGRTDVDKYLIGCSTLENFVPLVEGPLTKRMGLYYVYGTKDATDGAWFARFEFNTEQAYVLEFGDGYIRFYTNNGILLNLGVPYEIVSPWAWADLTNDDGTFALQMYQSADVIYITGGGKPPQKLSRVANTNWTIANVDFQGGPFNDVDPDQTITVYASAQTGTGITLTASSSIFQAGHVGCLFYLEQKPTDAIAQWEPGKSVTSTNLRRSDGNVYKALNTATTGSVKPTHTVGAKYDGDTGVQWEYQHSGYGWVKITGYTSGTQVTADVVSLIPDQATGVGNPTKRWAFQKWNGVDGYPVAVAFYRERLVFAKGIDVELSVAGDYENFRRKDGDQITADMAISMTLSSATVNDIKWMAAIGPNLIAGTSGGEFKISSLTDSSAFGPANKEAQFRVGRGSRQVAPLIIEDSMFYVQRNGRKVWELKFEYDTEKFAVTDKMIYSRHIAKGKIIQMAYQRDPHSILWAVTADGKLIAATISIEQGVSGWHRHPTDGFVKSIAVIPTTDGDDQLWIVVRRNVNGSDVHYVEYLKSQWDGNTDDVEDAFFVDSGLTYDGSPATVISGLTHLEGKTVTILADGASHPSRTVSSGSITLQAAASVVHVGLGFTSKMRTMRVEAGAADGTAQGKVKRITNVKYRLLHTVGGKVGPDENNLDEINFRSTGDDMDEPVAPATGDFSSGTGWPNGSDTDGYAMFVHDQPLPATLLAIMPRVVTEDS